MITGGLTGHDADATARAYATRDAQRAVAHLLTSLGEDVRREGLRDTPRRVTAFMEKFVRPEPFNFTTFDSEGMSEMITQAGITFYSLCEHHMLPFFGTAVVGYIPGKKIVGLSKLARCVRYHASGFQNQERITQAVAKALQEALEPKGVGVWLSARHMCMEMRGVQVADATSTTSCLLGAILDDEKSRAEFLRLTGGGR
jgi:GTP cyclohydrolase I